MEKEASQLERDHVHSVYEKIAPSFNDARYKAWPKVQRFISEQEPGSLIADIGCGNGKYLHINSQAYKLGCDYCFPLVESARDEGHEVMVCHSLCLPYRSECFDAVLSIAVIHHFSTEERRTRAIREMARILRVGGQIMIYVWAMEQKRRRFETQDVFVPWDPSPPCCPLRDPRSPGVQKSILHTDKKLAVHQGCPNSNDTSEGCRKSKSSSCGGGRKALCSVLDKPLRWSLFSRSLDSVLDVGNQRHREELVRYRNYTAARSRSTVCLPDLISRQKGLAVRQQHRIDPHPKQGAFCGSLSETGAGSAPQEALDKSAAGTRSGRQPRPSGACLRYYHVFKEGELVELIQRHIPELHVIDSYFDHANWCVIAEKTERDCEQ
uniref:Probable tRNA methyltransferase 9B n=1 Tax=Nothoprocta perdicaria TaxID=30464 RepID=A0A8C7EHY1_NOTPE